MVGSNVPGHVEEEAAAAVYAWVFWVRVVVHASPASSKRIEDSHISAAVGFPPLTTGRWKDRLVSPIGARPRQMDVAPPRSVALQPGRDFGLRHLFCLPFAQPRVLPRSVCIHTLPCRKYMSPRNGSGTAHCQSPPTQPALDAVAAAAETEKGTQPGSWHRTRPDCSSPAADLVVLARRDFALTVPSRLISQPAHAPTPGRRRGPGRGPYT